MTKIEYEIDTEFRHFGPIVILVQKIKDSDNGERIVKKEMQAYFAVEELLYSPENGRSVMSAHIEWGASSDLWSVSHGGFWELKQM